MEKIYQQFAKYVSFNVLGMIGLSCYILADTYFIAKGMGEDGLTALNMAIPVYSMLHGSGLMLGMGGAARYSVLKNRKMGEEGSRVFFQADSIASLFNSEGNKELQEMAVYGMKLYFTGCLAAGFNIVLSMYLTSTDRTRSGIVPFNPFLVDRNFIFSGKCV